jgi:hypothetical protein
VALQKEKEKKKKKKKKEEEEDKVRCTSRSVNELSYS